MTSTMDSCQTSQNNRFIISTTTIHIMALDGTLNVNSLFALAAFLGLALNPLDPNSSLVESKTCAVGPTIAEHFIQFHVYSFSSFLFSSLIVYALKLAIKPDDDDTRGGIHGNSKARHSGGHVNLRVLQAGILASASGSIFGCAFLMLALVDLVQIKLGSLGCWGYYTLAAVTPLLILVPSALLVYICLLFYAFTS